MLDKHSIRLSQRKSCVLPAEVIKLTGTCAVDRIRVTNFSKEGMCLISKKPMEIGSYLIIRIHDLSAIEDLNACGSIGTVGVTEVRWVKKIVDNGDLEFRTGVKYLFIP